MERINTFRRPLTQPHSKNHSGRYETRSGILAYIGRKMAVFSIVIYLLSPLLMTFIYSMFRDFTGILPRGFTLDFYKEIFSGGASLLPALSRTLAIAIVPVFLTLTITLLAVYASTLYFPRWDKALAVITKIPYSVQGVILAISLISIYANTNTFLANRIVLLTAAYCVVITPYMYQGVRNALDTVDMRPLLESAEVLGANRLYAFLRIVIPAAKNGLLATSLLCGGLLFGDFVLVNILAGSHLETLAIRLSRVMYYSGNQAAAISSVLFLCMFGLSLFVSRLQAGRIRNHTAERKDWL